MNRKTFSAFLLVLSLFACSWFVNAKSVKGPKRVACVGDSITFGAAIKDRAKNCYPAQLGRMLGEEWDVANFGVNGATLLKKGDKPYWKQKAFEQAHAFEPDVVIIKLGEQTSGFPLLSGARLSGALGDYRQGNEGGGHAQA